MSAILLQILNERGLMQTEADQKCFWVLLFHGASLAIKAFQLYWISYYLLAHGYIWEERGKDFADILWQGVAGDQLYECMAVVNRYYETGEDVALDVPTRINRAGNLSCRKMSCSVVPGPRRIAGPAGPTRAVSVVHRPTYIDGATQAGVT